MYALPVAQTPDFAFFIPLSAIAAVNDLPEAVVDHYTTLEDTPIVMMLMANDTDVDNNPLSYVACTSPSNGTLKVNGTNVTYSPNLNFNGIDMFTYRDYDGTANSSACANVTIVVTPGEEHCVKVLLELLDATHARESISEFRVIIILCMCMKVPITTHFHPLSSLTSAAVNDAPVAVADYATTPEDTAVVISSLSNDSDVDYNTTLLVYVCTNPANGSAVANTSNTPHTITYTPAVNFNGLDVFTYKVSDGFLNSSCVNVTINVTAGGACLWCRPHSSLPSINMLCVLTCS
jgi:hypothetical protein